MGFVQDFKDFALKGNLVDMAVGIVIGTATAKLVTSFMDNIISPLIGKLVGAPDLSGIKIPLGEITKEDGTTVQGAIEIGQFLGGVVDFLILAFAVFVAIKVMNSFMKKAEETAGPSAEVQLLTEIRDSLQAK